MMLPLGMAIYGFYACYAELSQLEWYNPVNLILGGVALLSWLMISGFIGLYRSAKQSSFTIDTQKNIFIFRDETHEVTFNAGQVKKIVYGRDMSPHFHLTTGEELVVSSLLFEKGTSELGASGLVTFLKRHHRSFNLPAPTPVVIDAVKMLKR